MATELKLSGLLLCVLLLQGCYSQWFYTLGTPLGADDAPDPTIEPTLKEVLDRLGPPQRMSATVSGYVMAWEYWDISDSSLGFSLGAAGADFLSVDWGTAGARGTFLLANFNHQHRLLGSAILEWDGDTGSGRGVQPLFGFVSVTEVDDLLRDMPQHRWGATSLGALPATLNSASDPDSGQAGLEQRGTPRNIGQNSLE